MLSKSCEYAIKAMIYLAKENHLKTKKGFKEVAAGINAPQPFMAKILQELSHKGLLLSAKGPGGGFYLPANYSNCSIAKIVRAIDGESIFKSCILGLDNCSSKKPCPLHNVYIPIKEQLVQMLEEHTLEQFDNEMLNTIYFLKR